MAGNQQHAAARPDAADLPPSQARRGRKSERGGERGGGGVRRREHEGQRGAGERWERARARADRPPPPRRLMVLEGRGMVKGAVPGEKQLQLC